MNLRNIAVCIYAASMACLISPGAAFAGGSYYGIRECNSFEKWGTPSANQAYVYSQTGYSDSCWVLEWRNLVPLYNNRWASYDASEGFPNDQIRSVKTGSGVRLVLFWNWFYTHDEGGTLTIPAGQTGEPGFDYGTTLGSWNGQASAARLVSTSQSQDCLTPPDSQNDYLALWDSASGPSGDCTLLSMLDFGSGAAYPDAVSMGYRNDNASYMKYWVPSCVMINFYIDNSYNGWRGVTANYSGYADFTTFPYGGYSGYVGSPGQNDMLSSLRTSACD